MQINERTRTERISEFVRERTEAAAAILVALLAIIAVIAYFVGYHYGYEGRVESGKAVLQTPQAPAQEPAPATPQASDLPRISSSTEPAACGEDSLKKPSKCIVQEGQTAWALARCYYGNPFYWTVIAEANSPHMHGPKYWLYTGMILLIPAYDTKKSPPPYPADAASEKKSDPEPQAQLADPETDGTPTASLAEGKPEEKSLSTTLASDVLEAAPAPPIPEIALPARAEEIESGSAPAARLQGTYAINLAPSEEILPQGVFPAYFTDACRASGEGREICKVREKTAVTIDKENGNFVLTVPLQKRVSSSGTVVIDLGSGGGMVSGVTGAQLLGQGRLIENPGKLPELPRKAYSSLALMFQKPQSWKVKLFGFVFRNGIAFARGGVPGLAMSLVTPEVQRIVRKKLSESNKQRLQLLAQMQALAQ